MRLQPGTHLDPDRNLPPGYSSVDFYLGGRGRAEKELQITWAGPGTAGGSHVTMSSPLTRVGLEFQR